MEARIHSLTVRSEEAERRSTILDQSKCSLSEVLLVSVMTMACLSAVKSARQSLMDADEALERAKTDHIRILQEEKSRRQEAEQRLEAVIASSESASRVIYESAVRELTTINQILVARLQGEDKGTAGKRRSKAANGKPKRKALHRSSSTPRRSHGASKGKTSGAGSNSTTTAATVHGGVTSSPLRKSSLQGLSNRSLAARSNALLEAVLSRSHSEGAGGNAAADEAEGKGFGGSPDTKPLWHRISNPAVGESDGGERDAGMSRGIRRAWQQSREEANDMEDDEPLAAAYASAAAVGRAFGLRGRGGKKEEEDGEEGGLDGVNGDETAEAEGGTRGNSKGKAASGERSRSRSRSRSCSRGPGKGGQRCSCNCRCHTTCTCGAAEGTEGKGYCSRGPKCGFPELGPIAPRQDRLVPVWKPPTTGKTVHSQLIAANGGKPIPFLLGRNAGKTHHVIGNVQMSLSNPRTYGNPRKEEEELEDVESRSDEEENERDQPDTGDLEGESDDDERQNGPGPSDTAAYRKPERSMVTVISTLEDEFDALYTAYSSLLQRTQEQAKATGDVPAMAKAQLADLIDRLARKGDQLKLLRESLSSVEAARERSPLR